MGAGPASSRSSSDILFDDLTHRPQSPQRDVCVEFVCGDGDGDYGVGMGLVGEWDACGDRVGGIGGVVSMGWLVINTCCCCCC